MEGQEGKYNIKAVSKLVGILPGTLRAWERRYKMIAPIRNELGYRLYTEEHIRILKWLNVKVNQGFTIGQAVNLLENRQLNLEAQQLKEENQLILFMEHLLAAFLDFNELKAQEIINSLLSLFTVEKVIFEILAPLLERIENLKVNGELTAAHQNFAVSMLCTKIKMIFHSFPQHSSFPKVMAICSPGETQETDLLLFSVFLRLRGLNVIYIGPGIAERELDQAVKAISPNSLFISCSLQENLTLVLSLVTQFTLNYKNLRVGIGGWAVNKMKKSEKEQFSRFIVGQTLTEWEKWLPNLKE